MGNSPPFTISVDVPNPLSAVASSAAMDDGNGAWPALYGSAPLMSTELRLAADEDQIRDSERSHRMEQFAFVIVH